MFIVDGMYVSELVDGDEMEIGIELQEQIVTTEPRDHNVTNTRESVNQSGQRKPLLL